LIDDEIQKIAWKNDTTDGSITKKKDMNSERIDFGITYDNKI